MRTNARRLTAPQLDVATVQLPNLLPSRGGSFAAKPSARRLSGGPWAGPPTPSTSTSLTPQSGGSAGPAAGLVESRNLRRFSKQRGLVQQDADAKDEEVPSLEELERDLQGWNGQWKKKKASVLILERLRLDREAEIRRREELEERRRRQEEKREHVRRTMEQEQRELQEEIKRHEARVKSLDAAKAWQNFAHRIVCLQDQLMEELKQPWTCSTCSGSGLCYRCKGEGILSVTYLSSSVHTRNEDAFRGRCAYGCHACGGTRDGRDVYGHETGELGSGLCLKCAGQGQIWPSLRDVLDQMEERKQAALSAAEPVSPLSPLSPR
ncbi:TANC1 [Symbiodinium natans]|uniref:TANC1 protein n=1 Tax=Symbiodinium natans TaxID=878477 RepID=A0A812JBH8_9DINO|nr:TANC1 [Symbiodinium natans]